MAKKKTKKKSAMKTVAKKKPVNKAASKSKPKQAAPPVAKKKLNTGSGASAREIGNDLVKLCNMGQLGEPVKKWYHKNIDSIEADGEVWLGMKGIAAKNAWWADTYETNSFSAEGPYVGATGFAVKFVMSITNKATGDRQDMTEVGVYTVKNGKIVREEFMYE
jgi:hypothetical protein